MINVNAQRAQGLCESHIWRGPRMGEPCHYRARWKRIRTTIVDTDRRVCGIHAKAYTPDSLVEIGSPGWMFA